MSRATHVPRASAALEHALQDPHAFLAAHGWTHTDAQMMALNTPPGPIPSDAASPLTLAIAETKPIIITVADGVDAIITDHAGASMGLIIGEGARVRLRTRTQRSCTRIAYLGKDATLHWHDGSVGEAHATHHATLAGTGAEVRYASVMLTTRASQNMKDDCAQHLTMEHAAPDTMSRMLTRAVLMHDARGTYRGTILIRPEAPRCDATQRADTLLLGEASRMDAVPILEIMTDDVQCGHGVAIGQIDEEQLFYLAARGIPRDDAVTMIVRGFFDPLLSAMGEDAEEFRTAIDAALQRTHAQSLPSPNQSPNQSTMKVHQ
jgi:Fe-S cluster assembly scaffold protein SufB